MTNGKWKMGPFFSGRSCLARLSARKSLSTRYHLDDLASDRSLPHTVHIQRERLDHFAGILRGRIHRGHSSAVLAGYRLQQRVEKLGLDVPRKQLPEYLRGRLLIQIVDRAFALPLLPCFTTRLRV